MSHCCAQPNTLSLVSVPGHVVAEVKTCQMCGLAPSLHLLAGLVCSSAMPEHGRQWRDRHQSCRTYLVTLVMAMSTFAYHCQATLDGDPRTLLF